MDSFQGESTSHTVNKETQEYGIDFLEKDNPILYKLFYFFRLYHKPESYIYKYH